MHLWYSSVNKDCVLHAKAKPETYGHRLTACSIGVGVTFKNKLKFLFTCLCAVGCQCNHSPSSWIHREASLSQGLHSKRGDKFEERNDTRGVYRVNYKNKINVKQLYWRNIMISSHNGGSVRVLSSMARTCLHTLRVWRDHGSNRGYKTIVTYAKKKNIFLDPSKSDHSELKVRFSRGSSRVALFFFCEPLSE